MRHIHPPTSILIATLHVLLRLQLVQQLLDGYHTDARHLLHVLHICLTNHLAKQLLQSYLVCGNETEGYHPTESNQNKR